MGPVKTIVYDGEVKVMERSHYGQHDIPALLVPKNGRQFTLNAKARSLLPKNVKRVRMVLFGDYVGITPDDHKTNVKYLQTLYGNATLAYPASLKKACKIVIGHHEVYKYKDGIAFNINECIE